ncbi:MAG TPA: BlaI/MecI/CopY family transcriptional regulator [Vicinamibacterales bacterium]|nr:BlaI/MecI/CopY family transcriptional regulator [Vicinamibacterales bacterium]
MLRRLFGGRWLGAGGDPIQSAFGVLERDVLRVLWSQGDLAVRDVQARLPRQVAYTTVMTTLDRLFKKGVLSRRRAGRAFRYSSAVTPEQLRAVLAGRVLSGLLQSRDGAALPVLSRLVDSVGSQAGGAELLRRLEELVRDKRRQLKQNPASRKSV